METVRFSVNVTKGDKVEKLDRWSLSYVTSKELTEENLKLFILNELKQAFGNDCELSGLVLHSK